MQTFVECDALIPGDILARVADELAEQRSCYQSGPLAPAGESGSTGSVSVGEVRQDKSGARYVEAVFQLPDRRVESQRIRLGGTGEIDRVRLATQLLDQLRRRLK